MTGYSLPTDKMVIQSNGDELHYLKGRLHRDDGPARISDDGTVEWYFNDLRHRVDGPAVVFSDGSEKWYRHGKLHREDGPAITEPGYQSWFLNDERHRDGGPAVVGADGYEAWYQHGKRHRADGPAVVSISSWLHVPTNYRWYLNGGLVTSAEVYRELTGLTDEEMFFLILKYGDIK